MGRIRICGILIVIVLALVPAVVPAAQTPTYVSEPDELVIYEGDVAYVKDTIAAYSDGEISVVLPPAAVINTVRITDGGRKVGSFMLRAGASATYGGIGSKQGTLISWRSPGRGQREIELSYLVRGLNWQPTYALEILAKDRVALLYRVQVVNRQADFAAPQLRLVSGMVSLPGGSERWERRVSAAQSALGEEVGQVAPLPTIGAARVNAYYAYDLGAQTLEEGQTFLTVLDTELPAKRELVWHTPSGERVDVIYVVTNTSRQPFSQGLVEVYQRGLYMGTDAIEWTPAGSEGHVTIGGAVDLRVKKTVDISFVPERKYEKEWKHDVALQVRNFSDETVPVRVVDTKYQDMVDVTYSPPPNESKAQTNTWLITLKPGEERILRYTFYSDSQYSGS